MGLMNRILQLSGTASAQGLLHHAANLRERVQLSAEVSHATREPRNPAAFASAEKKKLSTANLATAA